MHFAFGLWLARPLVELGMIHANISRRIAVAGMILTVLAIGAIYEIFEWLLTVSISPEAADRYNGQQRDMFDAQKDMALALLGALSLVPLAWPRWLSAPSPRDRSRPRPSVS